MNNGRHPSVLATSACAYIRHKSGDIARSRLEYGYKHYVVRAYFTTGILTIIASEWPVEELRWTCPTRPGLISPKCQPGITVLCTLSGSGRKLQMHGLSITGGLPILRLWRCVNDLKSQRLISSWVTSRHYRVCFRKDDGTGHCLHRASVEQGSELSNLHR